jgi:uncharacterized protein (UPF0262 family)
MHAGSPVLIQIRIDEPTWRRTASPRRREWQQLIADMIDRRPPDENPHFGMVVTPNAQADTVLEFHDLDGNKGGERNLPFEALAPHFREYCEICRRMSALEEGPLSARLQALDMGKKVAHDSAARTLSRLCAPELTDFATTRCFFSLLVSLHFDTALIARGHRVI